MSSPKESMPSIHDGFVVSGGDITSRIELSDRLFPAHSRYRVPGLAELNLEDLARCGDVLLDLGARLQGNLRALAVPDPTPFEREYGGSNPERWAEVAELLRSAGEAVRTSALALCEVEGMLRVAEEGQARTEPLVAAFTTEASLQYLISAGHNLLNAALRVSIEIEELDSQLTTSTTKWKKHRQAAASDPGDRAAWLFHSQADDLVRQFENCSSGRGVALVEAVRILARLHGAPAWKAANGQRDVYFHRTRYGFTLTSDGEPLLAARQFFETTAEAGRCFGRAVPSLYHRFLETSPRNPADVPLLPDAKVIVFNKDGSREERETDLAEADFFG